MIEINTLKGEGFEGEFYKCHFMRLGFLLFPAPDLSGLVHFSKSRQRQLGKTNVRFNLTSLLKYPHFFKDIHYILLTDYEQILFLPFLSRMLPDVTIIATSLMYQLSRISLEAFQERIWELDTTHETIQFFKESEILGLFEERMDVDFSNWRTLYGKEDIEGLLKKIVKVNYHQIYNTERGVLVRSFPSGKNNGACFWDLQAVLTNQKVLIVNELSQYNWRTCQPYSLERLKESQQQNPYQLVVFTKNALQSYAEGQQNRIADTIRRINLNASMGMSTTIVLEDDTFCIDLIPRLAVQPEGKVFGVLLGHQLLHNMHIYVNSYVDYLSQHYKDQIFCETPDYPLIHYSKLKQKGFLMAGTLDQLAIKRKLPVKQIILQSHPFVRFIKNYEYYLQLEDQSQISKLVKHCVEKIQLASNFNNVHLNEFVVGLKTAKMVGFGKTLNSGVENLEIGRKYSFGSSKQSSVYLTAYNFSSSIFQSFKMINNELQLSKVQLRLMKISKNWTDLLAKQLSAKRIAVECKDKRSIKTCLSLIQLNQEGQICLSSRSMQELQGIEQCLQGFGKKYDLY